MKNLPVTLLILYLLLWSIAAIDPLHRNDWFLENLLPAIFVPLFVFTYRKFRFSNTSYILIFLFMACHVLGSHYTYAEVPYDQWSQRWFGFSINELFGFERNHYDRLIHFTYGFFLAPPYREWLIAKLKTSSRASCLLTLEFIIASSALYELIEWAAAILFGGDLGMLFLGTQGDIWDAHWDIMLAGLGSAITLATMWLLRLIRGDASKIKSQNTTPMN